MCGLVGVMGWMGKKEKAVLHDMLIMDALRGKHSTGIATITSNDVVEVFKKAVNPIDFLDLGSVKKEMDFNHKCIIGHNRYATKGAINSANAHPFQFDKVVGAHNGTLRSYFNLDGYRDFEVDSECLYNHINNNGFEDAFKNMDGAFALTWYDIENSNLVMARNSERPLYYTYSSDKSTLFWASEAWMLYGALARNGIKHLDVVLININSTYTFNVPEGIVKATHKLDAPEVTKYVKPVVKKKSATNWGMVYGGRSAGYGSTSPSDERNYTKAKSFENTTVEFLIDDIKKDYLVGVPINEENPFKIRIHTPKGKELRNLLIERRDTSIFKAKIKTSTWDKNCYHLVADLRTVKESLGGNVIEGKFSKDVAEQVPSTIKGFAGEQLTYSGFKELNLDCAWCSDVIPFDDTNLFVGKREVLCKNCVQQEEVQEYIKQGSGGLH